MSVFASTIEQLMDRCEREGESEEMVSLLGLALRVSQGREEVASAREHVRRTLGLSPADIKKVFDIVWEIGKESWVERYAIQELIQAAGVASCGLNARNIVSGHLAVAAKELGHYERARAAHADAIEGLRIAGRFLPSDDDDRQRAEASLRDGWEAVKESAVQPLHVLDPATDDPAGEWIDLVVWNSDRAGGEGLLAQIDATQRLALRFEHWVETRGKLPIHLANEMRARCVSAADGDAFLGSRYLVSLGDALTEVGEWEAAAEVLLDVWWPELVRHPLGAHALIREAQCHLMLGDIKGCRARLDSVDVGNLKMLSELVITVAAELARYHAVDRLCRYWQGQDDAPGPEIRIAQLMRQVGAIVSISGEDSRTHYLRNLFFAVLARDVEALTSAAL
jgi:hypothetical protein